MESKDQASLSVMLKWEAGHISEEICLSWSHMPSKLSQTYAEGQLETIQISDV